MLAQLEKDFPGDVRVIYRHYPLNIHDKALLASQAAEAAGLQDHFWEMHDLLFDTQATWAGMTVEQFTAWLGEQAAALKLDTTRFTADLTSQAVVDKVATARADGERIPIPGTPFLLINGKIWQGPTDLANLTNLVQIFKLQERQFTGCPPMEIDPAKQYTATLQTEKGDIVIQLFASQAPVTVNSFVFLARRGWYDGVTFHRVVTNPDVAQTGDPSGTGWGGPGYAFKDEIVPELKFDGPGVVGMANSGADTNGSQFFITRSAIPTLDGRFTIFGKVIKGIGVLSQLTARDPSTGADLPPGDTILKVTIDEK